MATDLDRERQALDQMLRPARTPMRWKTPAIAVALLVLAGAWWFTRSDAPPPELTLPMASTSALETTTSAAESGGAFVHVAGAVVAPGVIEIPDGGRVGDAVAAAGGVRPDADVDRLNLAAPLTDGARVFVPVIGQPVPNVDGGPDGTARDSSGGGGDDGPVDLNSASVSELEQLAGVGPATAAAIVAFRDEHGRFGSVDDLEQVRGIGPAKLEAIRPNAVAGSG
jgi:competence protein ComEA